MSQKPIWSFNAKRSELGGATKGQIYLSKIGIGFAVWFVLWLAMYGNTPNVVVGCAAVFITSKVCYYVNKGESPDGWESVADWYTDGLLALCWYWLLLLSTEHYIACGITLALWIPAYPYSSE